MKKALNKFALWLYSKTKEQGKYASMSYLFSFKIMRSRNIPEKTLVVHEEEWPIVARIFIEEELKFNEK